jgi:cold shock CspA family protein
MAEMTREEVVHIAGAAMAESVVPEILKPGVNKEGLEEAFAWLNADDAKTREAHHQPHGAIQMLAPERDHGFITSADGREIYFHRNVVADDKSDARAVGQEVRFSEAAGDKGPQATFVRPVGKHHLD